MKNNDLIGKVVLSKAGRDKGSLYVCINIIDENFILLSNGSTKTVQLPKKKSIKHIKILSHENDEILASISSKDKRTDLYIKKFIKLIGIVKEG